MRLMAVEDLSISDDHLYDECMYFLVCAFAAMPALRTLRLNRLRDLGCAAARGCAALARQLQRMRALQALELAGSFPRTCGIGFAGALCACASQLTALTAFCVHKNPSGALHAEPPPPLNGPRPSPRPALARPAADTRWPQTARPVCGTDNQPRLSHPAGRVIHRPAQTFSGRQPAHRGALAVAAARAAAQRRPARARPVVQRPR